MSRRKLQNKELDRVGRQLIENGASRPNDIESIISNPGLFARVQERIAADVHAPAYIRKNNRTFFSFARRYSVAVVGSAMMFIAIIIGAASLFRPENPQIASKKAVQVPEVVPDVARPIVTPFKPVVSKLSAGRASDRDEHEARPEKIVARPNTRKADIKSPPPVQDMQDPFLPVSAAFDADEAGGRIVRVDVPKSTLFAMGVNIPLENGPESVKADLLIGPDGSTRAIRVVR
jgi:hypothetical protein